MDNNTTQPKPEQQPSEAKKTLKQIIVYALLSLITSAVDFGVFALCNYVIFTPLREIPLQWWLIDYNVEKGGLCAFWAFAVSYPIAQAVNYLLQRKKTFGANNNVAASIAMYIVMIIGCYVFTLWAPTVLTKPITALLGAGLGASVVKLLTQFLTAVIQFPLNKFVIMRHRDVKA